MKEYETSSVPLQQAIKEDAQESFWRRLRLVSLLPRLGVEQRRLLIAVVALSVVFSVLSPNAFATVSNLRNITRQGAVLAIVSLGQMFPLLVGGFDISVGAIMGLSSVVSVMVTIEYGILPGVIAGLLAATLMGTINGVLIARYQLSPFIVTLGMMTFMRGLALQLTKGTTIIGLPDGFYWLGASDWGPIPATMGIAIVVFLLFGFLLHRTRAGLYFYAIGGNEVATRLSGANVTLHKTLAYTLSGLLAGVAGIALSSRVASGQPTLGIGFELNSIATAVIGGVAIGGGTGTIFGVILGVLLMSILTTGMNIAKFSSYSQSMFTGLVIVAAAFWDYLRRRREAA